MKKDIILAGVGGQGILSIAAIIGYAAIEDGLNMKQAEVHGMSQRGGDVQSHLRISDKVIYSDLIPHGRADLIIGVEPMEALRYKPYLYQNGWLITNTEPFKNISHYPEMEKLNSELTSIQNLIAVNANQIAKDTGAIRSINIVMLGAASHKLDIHYDKLEAGIRFIFAKKGDEIIQANLNALKAGREAAKSSLK